jgi:serine/threonine-protein kinase ATR
MPENGSNGSMESATGALAAQLAPHLSQASQRHQFNRETFSQLRKELLEGRCSQLNLEDSVTDVNNLVCIVLKAGLGNGHHKSDLSITNDVNGQISDCLDIIQAAVDKAPQVLLELSNSEVLGNDISAPLYVWLVIRLIDLL